MRYIKLIIVLLIAFAVLATSLLDVGAASLDPDTWRGLMDGTASTR